MGDDPGIHLGEAVKAEVPIAAVKDEAAGVKRSQADDVGAEEQAGETWEVTR